MKKANIQPMKTETIEIREGLIFEIIEGDVSIIERAMLLEEKGKKLKSHQTSEIIAAIHDCRDFVDKVLGDGALAKIAGVDDIRRVNLNYAVEVMAEVAKLVVDTYNEKVKKEYDE